MRFVGCDACGKEVRGCITDWRTSDGSKGTGAFLCDRKRCIAKRGKVEAREGVEGLVRLYALQGRAEA